MKIQQWQMTAVGVPLALARHDVPPLEAGDALVRVSACGVCHTDLGFLYDGVKTRHDLPLTLGHEISGIVEDAGQDGRGLIGCPVIVPAVIPCGECTLCRRGRGSICARQVFPGNDIHGGFASHVVVPTRGLCRVSRTGPRGTTAVPLEQLSVVADAVSTPYQAVLRSGLGPSELAIVVGVGGVGAFCAQIAAARGAVVAAIDVDQGRLDLIRGHGATLAFNAREQDAKAIKKALFKAAAEHDYRATEWKIFECSGTPAGQETAFQLLVPGAYLSVIGFTTGTATVPVSRLMAFDARAEGNWGCLPELYPEALRLVEQQLVAIEPFIEVRPLSTVNQVLDDVHHGRLRKRPVLIPDFD